MEKSPTLVAHITLPFGIDPHNAIFVSKNIAVSTFTAFRRCCWHTSLSFVAIPPPFAERLALIAHKIYASLMATSLFATSSSLTTAAASSSKANLAAAPHPSDTFVTAPTNKQHQSKALSVKHDARLQALEEQQPQVQIHTHILPHSPHKAMLTIIFRALSARPPHLISPDRKFKSV